MKRNDLLKNCDTRAFSWIMILVICIMGFFELSGKSGGEGGLFGESAIFISVVSILLLGYGYHGAKRKISGSKLVIYQHDRMLSALCNCLPDIAWFKDAEFRYQYVNDAFLKKSRMKKQAVIGRTAFEVWPRETAIKCNADDETIHEKGTRIHVEHSLTDSDGAVSWVEIIKTPVFDENGCIIGSVGTARDITLRRQAENERRDLEFQLRQSQKMEAIGTLAGGIAHDFNNILAAIMGYTEICIDELSDGSRIKERMERILRAGYRGKELVDQILAFSRQNKVEKRTIAVSSIVEETVKMLRPLIPSNIKIRTNLSGSSRTIVGDLTQIHQIQVNLCTNAAYAMRETGGILDISVKDVDVDKDGVKLHEDAPPGPYVRLEVGDTGIGISPENLSRIFEPFYTTKRQGEGTGMGLSVVHGIVRSLNGIIDVDSRPGRGTTFVIWFPASNAAHEAVPEDQALLSRGNERIMVVDDEAYLVDMAKEMLESLGYKITTFTDSEKALEYFVREKGRIQLVITDMTMPGMTGEDLSRKLIEVQPGIPIILCTGFSHTLSRDDAASLGIRDYLMKPYVKRDLARIIRNVLDNRLPIQKR